MTHRRAPQRGGPAAAAGTSAAAARRRAAGADPEPGPSRTGAATGRFKSRPSSPGLRGGRRAGPAFGSRPSAARDAHGAAEGLRPALLRGGEGRGMPRTHPSRSPGPGPGLGAHGCGVVSADRTARGGRRVTRRRAGDGRPSGLPSGWLNPNPPPTEENPVSSPGGGEVKVGICAGGPRDSGRDGRIRYRGAERARCARSHSGAEQRLHVGGRPGRAASPCRLRVRRPAGRPAGRRANSCRRPAG